jgi:hypothetical protein
MSIAAASPGLVVEAGIAARLVLHPRLPVYALSPVCGYLVCRCRCRLLRWSGLRIRKPRAAEELIRGVLVEPVLPGFKGPHDGVTDGARVGTGML